jgi:pyruvate dehydrogenase E2 component (dihydrolipoamide acetyltransferase)
MPKLGLTMREGIVIKWRCRENDSVQRGGVILVIESEKVEFEVEAPSNGIVRALVIEQGTTVPCGEVLAVLSDTPDEPLDLEAFLGEARGEREAGRPEATARDAPRKDRVRPTREQPPVSPRARRLAEQEGVPLSLVVGTGPGGRITEADVQGTLQALGPRTTIGDARIAYADVEGPEPPVVFLAGFGLDRTAFNRQLTELAGWRRLLAPDPRGTGGSTRPEGEPATVEGLAADVEALLDALNVKHVDLVGSSLGAAVAAELSGRSPERVRRVVLISPPSESDSRLASALESFCRAADADDPVLRLQVMAPASRRWPCKRGSRGRLPATVPCVAQRSSSPEPTIC